MMESKLIDKERKFYTDYPFVELGDDFNEEAPIREIKLISYDGNKYCAIVVESLHIEIKSGYIYTESGRFGEVPGVTNYFLEDYNNE